MNFLSTYGDTEGPLGLPMKTAQAQTLATLLATLPAELRTRSRTIVQKATTEVMDGERADVSWISTEDLDHDGEVVLTKGLDDSHFALNPVVTLQHCYHRPPIGRSLWRKKAKDGDRRGVKAKTVYPTRPESWPATQDWEPDAAFGLVQSGLMIGKSIGFVALDAGPPTAEEAKQYGPTLHRVIRKWLLLEYACTWMPVNPAAVTEQVSKSMETLGLTVPDTPPPVLPGHIPFTPLQEVGKALERRFAALDLAGIAARAAEDGIARYRGRV